MIEHETAPQLYAADDEDCVRWHELMALLDFEAAIARAKAAGHSERAVRRAFRRLGHGGAIYRRFFDALIDAAFGVPAPGGADDAAPVD